MKRKFLILFVPLLLSMTSAYAQNFEYKWKRVAMDSLYDSNKVYEVDRIVSEHQGAMESLMKVLIHSDSEIQRGDAPETPMSNFSADFLLFSARKYIDNDYPTMSLTNRGGIRSNFPEGAIRVYDVMSTYPFDNNIVVAQIKGKQIRRILERFIGRNKFEALGGIELHVKNNKLDKCLIGGRELKDNELYNLVTIDFLLDGGDRFFIGKQAESILRTEVKMMDAAIAYLEHLNEQGITLSNKVDRRIKFE